MTGGDVMKAFEQVRDLTKPLEIKKLNDQLMLLWEKVRNIDTKDIRNGAVTGDKIAIESIDGKHIKPKSISVDRLNATIATVEDLQAIEAFIEDLEAYMAAIQNLQAEFAAIESLVAQKANITDLIAQVGRIDELYTDIASINTILSKDVFVELATAGQIKAGSSIIAEAAIGSAQIANLDVSKLTGGFIDTSRLAVQGSNGLFKIQDNLLQVFSGLVNPYERIAIGDIYSDGSVFGMVVRGADGQTVLFDENGLTDIGFTDGYNKLPNNSLDPGKIDIDKVITRINEDGTEVLLAQKIVLDNETLDVKFTNTINGLQDIISTQGAQISTIAGQIASKVWQTDIETAVDGLETILNHQISEVIIGLEGIESRVSDVEIETSDIGSTISDISTAISQLSNEITLTVKKSDFDTLSKEVEDLSAAISLDAEGLQITLSQIIGRLDDNESVMGDFKAFFEFGMDEEGRPIISLGKSDSQINLELTNEQLSIKNDGATVAYINGQKYYITHGQILKTLQVGVHVIEKYNDKITYVRWVGEN